MIKLTSLILELVERYGGSEKERSIWYHGTSMKRVPSIMSRGLDPNISPKNKSWDIDPDRNAVNLDKSSYGGIYVTQNLMTATSSGFRTARKDKSNEALVILSLQPRSLVGDEDDFASRLMYYKGHLAGSAYHSIYPYMWEIYGAPDYHKEYHDKNKMLWVEEGLNSLFYDFKIKDIRFKKIVRRMLYKEGYRAMLTRMVSYIDKSNHTDYWEWRKAYADVHGMGNKYGEEDVKIPDPPSPNEGERMFRAFIDKLTRTMKHKARHSFTGSFSKTARSLEPIGFHGKNRIVAIIEIRPSETEKYGDDIRILYGELPNIFKKQWESDKGKLRIVK